MDPGPLQGAGSPARRHQLESQLLQPLGDEHDRAFVAILHADKHHALARQALARRQLGFQKRPPEILIDPHHLAGRAHLRTQDDIHAGEAGEREHGFFHRQVGDRHFLGEALLAQADPDQRLGGELRQRHADGFGNERHGARRARVDFQDIDLVILHRVLHVHQPDDLQRFRQLRGRAADVRQDLLAQGVGGQDHRAVAGVNPGLLDVLQDPANDVRGAVADQVHVHLDGVLKELVDEHRKVR